MITMRSDIKARNGQGNQALNEGNMLKLTFQREKCTFHKFPLHGRLFSDKI